MPLLLSIKNLSIRFSNDGEESIAVKNSSIEINSGEMVAIVGESGSGKSVTALSLLKLLPKGTGISGELIFTKNEQPVDLLSIDDAAINKVRGKDIPGANDLS